MKINIELEDVPQIGNEEETLKAISVSGLCEATMPFLRTIEKVTFGAYICTMVEDYCKNNGLNTADYMEKLAEVAKEKEGKS